MNNAPKRMWINQPSTQQPLHRRHGENVLAVHEYDDTWKVFFLSGEITSMQVSRLWISEGWIEQPDTKSLEEENANLKTELAKAVVNRNELAYHLDAYRSLARRWTGHDPFELDAVQAAQDARFCLDNHDVLHTPGMHRAIITGLLKNIEKGDDRRHYICVCPECIGLKETDRERHYRLEITKVMEESQKLYRLKNNYLHALLAANRTIEEARECFKAAEAEGLEELACNTADEPLKDLLQRRISYARSALFEHTDFVPAGLVEEKDLITAGFSTQFGESIIGVQGLQITVADEIAHAGKPILVFRLVHRFDTLAAFFEFQSKFRKDGVL